MLLSTTLACQWSECRHMLYMFLVKFSFTGCKRHIGDLHPLQKMSLSAKSSLAGATDTVTDFLCVTLNFSSCKVSTWRQFCMKKSSKFKLKLKDELNQTFLSFTFLSYNDTHWSYTSFFSLALVMNISTSSAPVALYAENTEISQARLRWLPGAFAVVFPRLWCISRISLVLLNLQYLLLMFQ